MDRKYFGSSCFDDLFTNIKNLIKRQLQLKSTKLLLESENKIRESSLNLRNKVRSTDGSSPRGVDPCCCWTTSCPGLFCPPDLKKMSLWKPQCHHLRNQINKSSNVLLTWAMSAGQRLVLLGLHWNNVNFGICKTIPRHDHHRWYQWLLMWKHLLWGELSLRLRSAKVGRNEPSFWGWWPEHKKRSDTLPFIILKRIAFKPVEELRGRRRWWKSRTKSTPNTGCWNSGTPQSSSRAGDS